MKAIVYHQQNRDKMFEASIGAFDMKDFQPVAEVDCSKAHSSGVAPVVNALLEYAYLKTNSIDGYWGDNKEVKDLTGENRSTSVGDVIEVEGVKHMVGSFGFQELQSYP